MTTNRCPSCGDQLQKPSRFKSGFCPACNSQGRKPSARFPGDDACESIHFVGNQSRWVPSLEEPSPWNENAVRELEDA